MLTGFERDAFARCTKTHDESRRQARRIQWAVAIGHEPQATAAGTEV